MGPEVAEDVEGVALLVRKDAVRIAIPLDAPRAYSPARIRTRRRRLTVSLGLFTATGAWHLAAGGAAQLVPMLAGYSRRFVPLTEGCLRYLPDNRYDTTAPVLLVNTGDITTCIADQMRPQLATSLQGRTPSVL